MADPSRELIFRLLREKIVLKQEVFERTQQAFLTLKSTLAELYIDVQKEIRKLKKDVPLELLDKGEFETEFTLADDTMIFLLHTNVFTFENNHEMWKSSYVKENPNRAFCGKIDIYNFLSDSFKYNRGNDVGYLIARIFVNHESHFFVEGKRQLGFLYIDFQNSVLDKENIRKVTESALLYSLDFDPYSPPFEQTIQISVQQILDSTLQSKIATGKRLGFRFHSDSPSF